MSPSLATLQKISTFDIFPNPAFFFLYTICQYLVIPYILLIYLMYFLFSPLEWKPYESRDIVLFTTLSITKNNIWHKAVTDKCLQMNEFLLC